MRQLGVLALCLGFLGCAGKGYDGPARIPLSGKVTFDGQPVDGGIISFMPMTADSKDQRPAGGPISGGEYTIPEGQGVPAGTYQVEIRWSKPTGKQIKDTSDTGEMIDEVKQVIPDKYNAVTELRAEVSSSKNTFDFDLQAK